MQETTMPAAEAMPVTTDVDERPSYELAFHVLPTVAEGEVTNIFDSVKELISKANGQIFDEETPERFELAYEIEKHLEGKNRKFKSAYFGWIRFKTESDTVEEIANEMEARTDILRHLLIRLTKVEEEHPFRFHEALAAEKMVQNVDESDTEANEEVAEGDETSDNEADTSKKEDNEVDEKELDEALKKDEA